MFLFSAVSFARADAVQAIDSRVVLLKATSTPGRLSPSAPSPQKKALLFMLCAFHKNEGVMQPAFCVGRTSPAGSYAVDHAMADYISGGPILNLDDGTVAGVLMKSDPPKIKPPGPVKPRGTPNRCSSINSGADWNGSHEVTAR